MPPAAPILAAPETQSVQVFERSVTKTLRYQYLLHLPRGYEAGGSRAWPLLVFLHGSGERGGDPWQVARHGPPKLLLQNPPAPADETAAARTRREEATRRLATEFIVVSPQCPAGAGWDDEAVLALVEEIAARHRVDPARIYLTGLSLGGFGTWSVGMKHPARFAAIAPICGGGNRIDVLRGSREHKAAFLSLGVWVFHGAKDTTVPPEESELMVRALQKAGVKDVRLTVYPEARHDSWTETYANPELYTWLLTHQR
jgi:predicted peptidase